MLPRSILVLATALAVLASGGPSIAGEAHATDASSPDAGPDWHWSTALTDASTGLGLTPPALDDYAVCWEVNPAPHAITAQVHWDPPLPADAGLSNVEFALVFFSQPDVVRGPPPLLWSHTLTEEDRTSCFGVHLRADGSSANLHVEQKVDVWAWFT